MKAEGLSSKELGRMHDLLAAHVDRGALPGFVTLVARGDEVHVDAYGTLGFGSAAPMRRDTVFRITSMTKPIAAAAALGLVEEGKLALDAPVDGLLPELANRRVLKRLDGPVDETVPAGRPITLRDLLTFEMGFGLVWGPQRGTPIQRAADDLDLCAFGPPAPGKMPAPDEWLRRFATLPLMHQPGARWMYNTSAIVLGILVARAAKAPFDETLREKILAPLGMNDTAFFAPPAKIDRLATGYAVQPSGDGLDVNDEATGGQWSRAPAHPSADGGLVSTVDDVLAFGRMLLDRGVHRGKRILSEATVREMTRDQIADAEKRASGGSLDPKFWDDHGWGFGLTILTRADAFSIAPGRFGWDGGFGTSWYSDPGKDLVAILMTQRAEYPATSPVYRDFWTQVYRAAG